VTPCSYSQRDFDARRAPFDKSSQFGPGQIGVVPTAEDRPTYPQRFAECAGARRISPLDLANGQRPLDHFA
jgi:hypothetical protein